MTSLDNRHGVMTPTEAPLLMLERQKEKKWTPRTRCGQMRTLRQALTENTERTRAVIGEREKQDSESYRQA
ncbi:hypothetical protein E2C01_019206 [Portunus trituberculatus]|uniref:Uncharacterized protein n=1 Tax=Portunus trituberculatus TaxID=210409 RepID=A0A5B7DXM4_PORTR|nr:hypothetical protein [Portunus trituberculatus]